MTNVPSLSESTLYSSRWKWLDYTLLTVAFFLIVHDFDAPKFLFDDSYYELYAANAGSGSLDKQAGILLLSLYGILTLFAKYCPLSLRPVSTRLAIIFFVLVSVSISWSVAPSASAARWFGLTVYILTAFGTIKRLSTLDIVRWYVFATSIYLVIGLGNELRLQTFNPIGAEYRFSGVSDPNTTGIDAALLVLASIAMLRISRQYWLYWTTLIMAMPFLVLTKSRTALLTVLFCLLLYLAIVTLRASRLVLYLYLLTSISGSLLIISSLDLVNFNRYLSLGRAETSENTLTGRIPLWADVYHNYILKRPAFGYGYGAFWTADRTLTISEDEGWTVAASHNIYLDAILAIGVCGLLLYLATLLSALVSCILAVRRGLLEAFFFGSLILAALLDGVSDSGPWFISSLYLFGSIQSIFVISSLYARNNLLKKQKVLHLPILSPSLTDAGVTNV